MSLIQNSKSQHTNHRERSHRKQRRNTLYIYYYHQSRKVDCFLKKPKKKPLFSATPNSQYQKILLIFIDFCSKTRRLKPFGKKIKNIQTIPKSYGENHSKEPSSIKHPANIFSSYFLLHFIFYFILFSFLFHYYILIPFCLF